MVAGNSTLFFLQAFSFSSLTTTYITKVLPSIWVLSLALVLLTVATPLEFVPLVLGNVPRWALWGLAFPACHQLGIRTGRFRLVWKALPWVLWLLLLAAEGFAVWGWFHRWHRATFWKSIRYPLEVVFANQDRWETERILFRRGPLVVVHQLCWHPRHGVVDLRQARLVPLLPGLQWATRLSTAFQPGVVDASWQLVDTVGAQMSQDTALQRRVKPWLLKHEEESNKL
jgi:hypothetical protein